MQGNYLIDYSLRSYIIWESLFGYLAVYDWLVFSFIFSDLSALILA